MNVAEPEFERFFLENYERLVSSLTAVTGDREAARDCVQEAFIKASTKWRRIRRYDDPVAWVRRVAINRSRDHHRSQQRRRRREAVNQQAVSDPAVDPATDGIALFDSAARLHQLFLGLPEQQRASAGLFYLEDLPVSEIASSLGISEGAVKYHLNQARHTLRALVEQEYQHGG